MRALRDRQLSFLGFRHVSTSVCSRSEEKITIVFTLWKKGTSSYAFRNKIWGECDMSVTCHHDIFQGLVYAIICPFGCSQLSIIMRVIFPSWINWLFDCLRTWPHGHLIGWLSHEVKEQHVSTYLTLQWSVVTMHYVPTASALQNSAFCLQNIFMFFVWSSNSDYFP
jgi:hypothetical protein